MALFNEVIDRRNTKSVKWDKLNEVFGTEDVLPMWIADMDFKAPQEVNDALIKHAEHGVYGYTIIDDNVKGSIVNWIKRRHQWDIDPDWLDFTPGVVPALHIAIQAFSKPGDKILVQTPVYTPFFKAIESQGREILNSPLLKQDGAYEIDFADFEAKLSQGVEIFILCSPHNPIGRVWTKDELTRILDLCVKYDVLILSDEIHSDLIYTDHKHIPIASLSKEAAAQTITFMAPSKTFNLAGLQASYFITCDDNKRAKMNEGLEQSGLNALNTMGIIGMEAAYEHGDQWLSDVIDVLEANQAYVLDVLKPYENEISVIPAEGTYLMWVDFEGLNMTPEELQTFMIEEAKIGLNPGIDYGKGGEHYMRINIGCPRELLEEGMTRLTNAIDARK